MSVLLGSVHVEHYILCPKNLSDEPICDPTEVYILFQGLASSGATSSS